MPVDHQPRWVQLEDRVERFLAEAGYRCRRNLVLTGRSGATHEIDVFGERSDSVTRYRLAVECKAWDRPVDKETVTKLAFVASDIGADKGILVALGGTRIGAARTAEDLGVELWGPSDLEDRLGPPALAALRSAPAPRLGAGVALTCAADRALSLVDRQARGRFGVRRERVLWCRPAWVAHQVVVIATTVEGKPFLGRPARRSAWRTNLYDAVIGTYWRTLPEIPPLVPVDLSTRIPPVVPAGRVAAAVRTAAARRDAAVGDAAWSRWAGELESLGVPGDAATVAVERTETLYWPFWLGLLTTPVDVRLVAVDGATGAVCAAAGQALTAGLGHVLRSLGETPSGSAATGGVVPRAAFRRA